MFAHPTRTLEENIDLKASLPHIHRQVLSIGVLGFGLRSVVETSEFSEIIGTRELTTAALVMLSIAVCMFAATPLGLFSVINKQNTMMLTYMAVTFFACLFSALCAWLGLNLKHEVERGVILQWMNTSFLKEYGHPEAVALTESWDNMQRKTYGEWQIKSPNRFKQFTFSLTFKIPQRFATGAVNDCISVKKS
ncbi:unnamed protein product [Cylicocyclus nassatus]|uniref:Uncharacterized protein n=1 Tax=Cylicocyclus nassatus TaxID=53992 RepID=A0AA36GUF9_CYLNA|nr:unnamed protein product [Cylicocyclus nassatus]